MFWKIYGVVMTVDLAIYLLIFYAGRAIPPASPDTSFPGNYGLCIWWIIAHFPTAWIYTHTQVLPDSLLWILIFQDVWVAGMIALLVVLWRRRKTR
jgi:hypothetical protein